MLISSKLINFARALGYNSQVEKEKENKIVMAMLFRLQLLSLVSC